MSSRTENIELPFFPQMCGRSLAAVNPPVPVKLIGGAARVAEEIFDLGALVSLALSVGAFELGVMGAFTDVPIRHVCGKRARGRHLIVASPRATCEGEETEKKEWRFHYYTKTRSRRLLKAMSAGEVMSEEGTWGTMSRRQQ